MANFNLQQQFHYFEGDIDGSFRPRGVIYIPTGYHQHLQNFNWESAPHGYYNPCYGLGNGTQPIPNGNFQGNTSMDNQCTQWYNGLQQYDLESEGGKGYVQCKEDDMDKHEEEVRRPRTYLDKLKEAEERKREKEAEPLLDNYISTLLTKTVKQINRENGNVGKHAERIRYKRPKKFNDNDLIKAYIIDNIIEMIYLEGTNIRFIRRRCVGSLFLPLNIEGQQDDIHSISKLIIEESLKDVYVENTEEDLIKCYVLLNSIDYLTIPSKNLVYQRNKITGGLFTKSERTLEDIADLNLEEKPVIFLAGHRQTAINTEDGKLIKQCRLIVLDNKQDEYHFYNELRKIQEKYSSNKDRNEGNEELPKDEPPKNERQNDESTNKYDENRNNDELEGNPNKFEPKPLKLSKEENECNLFRTLGFGGLVYGFGPVNQAVNEVKAESNLKEFLTGTTENIEISKVEMKKKKNVGRRFLQRFGKPFRRMFNCGRIEE